MLKMKITVEVLVTSRHPVAERGPVFLQLPVITGFPDTYLRREMTKKGCFGLLRVHQNEQVPFPPRPPSCDFTDDPMWLRRVIEPGMP